MARIPKADTKTFRIDKWLGLNEAPDGDATLKYGEAQITRNWTVTKDGSLLRRPGTRTVALAHWGVPNDPNYDLTNALDDPAFPVTEQVRYLWSGKVAGQDVMLALTDVGVYRMEPGEARPRPGGTSDIGGRGFIFGFGGKAYILAEFGERRKDPATGQALGGGFPAYYEYDGQDFTRVEGYVPVVTVAVPPGGGGTTLEMANKLTPFRRAWFSPDGTSRAFHLPEKDIAQWQGVTATDRTTGQAMTGFTVDWAEGVVTFSAAPAAGVNTIEIKWAVKADTRNQVAGMRYAEMYNGTSDNRVFLYGDGTNKLIYSGLDYNGVPRADYFPDLNEVAVGAENTPVTGAVKHYSRLIVFKPDETYTLAGSTLTLADGTVTPVFYLTPANRALGNEAMGQAQLVLNSPRTLCAKGVYEWKNNSSYTANLTVDERQAKRLSDRVQATLAGFDFSHCLCWDDNAAQEYYIIHGTTALVHNYAADAWYVYTDFPALAMCRHKGELYLGGEKCLIRHVSRQYDTDDGKPINAYWESGSMDFGTITRLKYYGEFWLACTPVRNGRLVMAAHSARAQQETEVETGDAGETFDFKALAFPTLSFDFKRLAFATHVRLRMRRFNFCKLMVTAEHTGASACIMGLTANIVYGGESR